MQAVLLSHTIWLKYLVLVYSVWSASGRGVQQPVNCSCGVSLPGPGVQGATEGYLWGRRGSSQGAEAFCASLCGAGPPTHAPLCSLLSNLPSGTLTQCLFTTLTICTVLALQDICYCSPVCPAASCFCLRAANSLGQDPSCLISCLAQLGLDRRLL